MSWTPEKVEKLKQLWGKGNTASRIATIIGGVTRNAVIGKAFRLKLGSKSISKNNNFKQELRNQENNTQSRRKTHRSKFISTLITKSFPPEKKLTLEELEEKDGILDCRFPNGDPSLPYPEFNFCGRPSVKGFSYCLAHIPLIYVTKDKDKKEDVLDKNEEVPKFIEKKIKSA